MEQTSCPGQVVGMSDAELALLLQNGGGGSPGVARAPPDLHIRTGISSKPFELLPEVQVLRPSVVHRPGAVPPIGNSLTVSREARRCWRHWVEVPQPEKESEKLGPLS